VIVLASASPRRNTLLREAGLRFEVDPARVDETVAPEVPVEEVPRLLAERKALAVAARRGAEDWVLGADTVVAVRDKAESWRLLGKPVDEKDAANMLALLSDSRHRVLTGVAVVQGGGAEALLDLETTWVTMRTIQPDEQRAYVASGEWRDKAGGYAIQESADRFVTALEGGGFDNVVGLPVARALQLLERAGAGTELRPSPVAPPEPGR